MSSIYYLPGRDGRLTKGLGTFLQEQCDQLVGREVSGDLKGLKFEEQLEVIRQDLLESHWHEVGQIVANSYGACTSSDLMEPFDPISKRHFSAGDLSSLTC